MHDPADHPASAPSPGPSRLPPLRAVARAAGVIVLEGVLERLALVLMLVSIVSGGAGLGLLISFLAPSFPTTLTRLGLAVGLLGMCAVTAWGSKALSVRAARVWENDDKLVQAVEPERLPIRILSGRRLAIAVARVAGAIACLVAGVASGLLGGAAWVGMAADDATAIHQLVPATVVIAALGLIWLCHWLLRGIRLPWVQVDPWVVQE